MSTGANHDQQPNGAGPASNNENADATLATTPPSQPDTQAYLAAFFLQYPEFQYNPAQPSVNQFNRLSRISGWARRSAERTDARRGFQHALVLQFNATYGIDQNDLASWQNLCRALKVEDIPSELSKCKKLVKGLFINLIDLVDMPNTGQPVRKFETELELSKYTKRREKFMSKEDAHAGGILKYLLRKIFFPRIPKKDQEQSSQA